MDAERAARLVEAPIVAHVHRHERRDMEDLVELPAPHLRPRTGGIRDRQHIGVALMPGRIGDLRHDGLQPISRGVVDIVETDRIGGEPEIAQMGQQADGAGWSSTGPLFDEIAHGSIERYARVTEIVGASEPGERGSSRGPEPAVVEQRREFGEVDPGHEEPIAESVPARPEAAMADVSGVQGAVRGAHVGTPPRLRLRRTGSRRGAGAGALPVTAAKSCKAHNPLTTPSSWNPYRQYAPQK